MPAFAPKVWKTSPIWASRVAEFVAEPVVDGLETIDIAHQRNGRLLRFAGIAEKRCGCFVKAAPVHQSSERIGAGDVQQFGLRLYQLLQQAARSITQAAGQDSLK